jgi:hypothetical protein
MQVDVRCTPGEIEDAIRDRITSDVTDALNSIRTVGNEFVVNDTPWYGPNGGKVRPRVVNSADFLSRRFTGFLKDHRGWDREKVVGAQGVEGEAAAEGQKIDAYIELETSPGFILGRANLFPFVEEYTADHTDQSPDRVMVLFYQMYACRTCFQVGPLEEKYRHYFEQADTTRPIRIGLEFETGNIASSFRSLNKLGFLYRRGLIDAGVFITSRDKGSATRIWPASNRNGSFQVSRNWSAFSTETRSFYRSGNSASLRIGMTAMPLIWGREAPIPLPIPEGPRRSEALRMRCGRAAARRFCARLSPPRNHGSCDNGGRNRTAAQ